MIATKKGVNILDRGSQVQFVAEFQELLDFPPAPKVGIDGRLNPATASQSEVRGETVFFGKAKCGTCHPGPYYTDNSMHNLRTERFYTPRIIHYPFAPHRASCNTMGPMFKTLGAGCILSLSFLVQALTAIQSFSTGGHAVYHLQPATVEKNASAIISAAWDGFVQCHTPDGRLLWTTPTGGNMPYDLAIADLKGDGLGEVLVASSDGVLYAIAHDGRPLWTFRTPAPLFQVASARLPDGSTVLLTGGVEQTLYVLSAGRKVVRTLKTEHCIRHIRTGHIEGNGRDYEAIATASTGLNGLLSILMVDPRDLKVFWKRTHLGTFEANSGRRFFSMLLVDTNGGFEMNLTDGILRTRYRGGAKKRHPMTPGEIYEIDPLPTANVFKKGHRIRLDIYSSNFPHYDVNPNTGEPLGINRRTTIAVNTVYHDPARRSHVVLPILRRTSR